MRDKLTRLSDYFFERTVKGKLRSLASLYPWQRERQGMLRAKISTVAPDPQDTRLATLERRYTQFDERVTVPKVWTADIISEEDLKNFRGDTQYVWQRGYLDGNEIAYALSYYSLKAGGAADLLAAMTEDGEFGVLTLELDDRLVSRDLLDSVSEIDFLRRHAGLGSKPLALLDIGAGYGRLAHRLCESVGTTTRIFATDAFATSTFLSEYYLAHRGCDARVIPLDEVEAALAVERIDIATNIHSFSECTVEAIEWWVERLAGVGVQYLMVVPNTVSNDALRCLAKGGHDMSAIFERAGYALKVAEPRHRDPFIQQFGVDPAHLFLFELQGTTTPS